MSDMERQKGIIRRLGTKETLEADVKKLIKEGKITKDQVDYFDGKIEWIDSRNYDIVNGALFDFTDAPRAIDGYEDVDEAERLNETDYRIHMYWYNGGDSPLAESIERADKEYEKKGEKSTFYAVKFNDGSWWTRGTNRAPITFSSEARARGTMNSQSVGKNPDTYKIVKFVEQ